MAKKSSAEGQPKKRRRKGEGTIIELDDGTFMAQISIKDPRTGARKRPTVYGKTNREIQKKLLKLRADAENGINLIPEKITLNDWMSHWLENYARLDKREVTWRAYELNFTNHIKDSFIGKKLLLKLTTSDLQMFYKDKLEGGRLKKSKRPEITGLSVGTVRKLHNIISASLSQAEEENLIRSNIAKAVKLPSAKENQKEMTPLTEKQIGLFLDSINNDRYRPAYFLELGTGMRKSELLGLKWSDIDFVNGTLSIKRALVRLVNGKVVLGPPKTKKSMRTISIPATALECLKQHKVNQENEKERNKDIYNDQNFVFAIKLGRWVDPHVFYRDFCNKLERINMPHVSFHTLRHSVATVLLEKGVNLKIISDLLGHASVAITGDIYSHVTPKAKQDTADLLDKVIGSILAVDNENKATELYH